MLGMRHQGKSGPESREPATEGPRRQVHGGNWEHSPFIQRADPGLCQPQVQKVRKEEKKDVHSPPIQEATKPPREPSRQKDERQVLRYVEDSSLLRSLVLSIYPKHKTRRHCVTLDHKLSVGDFFPSPWTSVHGVPDGEMRPQRK